MVASVHGVCACGHELQSFDPQCPSCGKQLSAPNVRMALAQRDRLHSAYHLKRQSTARGLRLEELEACIGSDGRIVVNMRYSTIRELLENPQVTYGNFWQDFVADRIVERNEALVARRMQVDAALFAQHTKRIRSAVLSPDGLGATFYGRFAVTLRQLLIADRTSLLENNPFNVDLSRVNELLRAIWDDRAKLAVVRYGDSVATSDVPIATLIRVIGAERDGQAFMEAHIWDTFTREAFENVVAQVPPGALDPQLIGDLARIEDLCNRAGIAFERVEDVLVRA